MSVCQTCGACCAAFRVDFHRSEAAGGAFVWGEGVPQTMTVPLTPTLLRMQGTDLAAPRCVALRGEIGEAVACRIYDGRSSPCREFEPHHPACNRARRRHGLPPLD